VRPLPVARRRQLDRLVAASLALAVVAAGVIMYLTSDARATTLVTAADVPVPAAMGVAPASLAPVWRLTSSVHPVMSPYGSVVTSDGHAVVGHDPVTGTQRWSYTRSNLPLCALGSGDADTVGLQVSNAVHGIVTGYAKGDTCSEITLLNPITGDRSRQRTGFTAASSELVFGGPYGGMISSDLVELWRFDLVRTIQYGNQPEPTKPNTKHLGCEFNDIAIGSNQFGTIEHCAADGSSAKLVINYADPGAAGDAKTKGWDNFKFEPRATVILDSDSARLLTVGTDDVLVLVASPSPAGVRYSSAGVEQDRTPVDIPADEIAAADATRVTPVAFGSRGNRYLLVGTTLVAVSGGNTPRVLFTLPQVLGVPAAVGEFLLVPVTGGLTVVDADDGSITATIPVDRADWTGRVDVSTVGRTVVETRGTDVIGLRDPALPPTDPPSTAASTGAPTRGGLDLGPLITGQPGGTAPTTGELLPDTGGDIPPG
jgi:hypothetical protein